MIRFKSFLAAITLFALPLLVGAQASEVTVPVNIGDNIGGITAGINNLFSIIAPILIAVVIIYLLFGAFTFATAGGDEEKRERGKNILLYGLIGVFLIVSIIGLINFVINSFTIGTNDTITSPPAPVITPGDAAEG